MSLLTKCGDILVETIQNPRVQFSDRQYFNILNDLKFLKSSFTPQMQDKICTKLGKEFTEFSALIKKLDGNRLQIFRCSFLIQIFAMIRAVQESGITVLGQKVFDRFGRIRL